MFHVKPENQQAAQLVVTNLNVSYPGGLKTAISEINFTVKAGETLAIVGQSGSGKTTIAKALLGLLPQSQLSGSIKFSHQTDTVELLESSELAWQKLRGKSLGFVPQDITGSLNPIKTVGKTLNEVLKIHSAATRQQMRHRAVELLKLVDLDEQVYKLYPHELSGGMRQRVLIAAAISHNPSFLIADEITSALDPVNQRIVVEVLHNLQQRFHTGLVFITHDLALAAQIADRVVVLQNGKIVENAAAKEIFTQPKTPYVAQLVAATPKFTANTPAATKKFQPGIKNLIEVRGLDYKIRSGRKTVPLLAGVTFQIAPGQTHAIIGKSGSGKTTLAKLLTGFLNPTHGEILLDGIAVKPRKQRELSRLVQLVYQNPTTFFDPRRTIGQALADPLKNFSLAKTSEIPERIITVLAEVGLEADFCNRLPAALSGGQLQRAMLARALLADPKLLVFDEALSALDVVLQADILQLLRKIQKQRQLGYVFISHDLAVVQNFADTVTVLDSGKAVATGSVNEVFSAASAPAVAQLLAAANFDSSL